MLVRPLLEERVLASFLPGSFRLIVERNLPLRVDQEFPGRLPSTESMATSDAEAASSSAEIAVSHLSTGGEGGLVLLVQPLTVARKSLPESLLLLPATVRSAPRVAWAMPSEPAGREHMQFEGHQVCWCDHRLCRTGNS